MRTYNIQEACDTESFACIIININCLFYYQFDWLQQFWLAITEFNSGILVILVRFWMNIFAIRNWSQTNTAHKTLYDESHFHILYNKYQTQLQLWFKYNTFSITKKNVWHLSYINWIESNRYDQTVDPAGIFSLAKFHKKLTTNKTIKLFHLFAIRFTQFFFLRSFRSKTFFVVVSFHCTQ